MHSTLLKWTDNHLMGHHLVASLREINDKMEDGHPELKEIYDDIEAIATEWLIWNGLKSYSLELLDALEDIAVEEDNYLRFLVEKIKLFTEIKNTKDFNDRLVEDLDEVIIKVKGIYNNKHTGLWRELE